MQRFARTLDPGGTLGTLPTLRDLEASLMGEQPRAAPAPLPAEHHHHQQGAGGKAPPQQAGEQGEGSVADSGVRLQIALLQYLLTGLFDEVVEQLAGERGGGGGGGGGGAGVGGGRWEGSTTLGRVQRATSPLPPGCPLAQPACPPGRFTTPFPPLPLTSPLPPSPPLFRRQHRHHAR